MSRKNTYYDIDLLLKDLKSDIEDTLMDEVLDEVKRIEIKHVEDEVFAVYTPKIYKRRKYDGIDDPDNIIGDVKDMVLEVENIAEFTNGSGTAKRGVGLAEFVNDYDYPDGSYSIEEESLLELINTKIEEANTAVSYEIKKTDEVLKNTQLRLEAYQAEKSALSQLARLVDSGQEGKAIDIYGTEQVMDYQNLQDEEKYLQDKLNELYGLQEEYITKRGSVGKALDSGSTDSNSKNIIDWIETIISRIQRSITNLGKTVSTTYKKWSTRMGRDYTLPYYYELVY